MKYIVIILFVLFGFISCGAPYSKKYPFEPMDDYQSWMVFEEGDSVYFKNDSSIDTIIIYEKRERVPKNSCPIWLENFEWARDIHEYHGLVSYIFFILHQGARLQGLMYIRKDEMGQYASFHLSINGITDDDVNHVNELVDCAVCGVHYKDCIIVKSQLELPPDTIASPAKLTSICWSKSRGLLYYDIDGKRFLQLNNCHNKGTQSKMLE